MDEDKEVGGRNKEEKDKKEMTVKSHEHHPSSLITYMNFYVINGVKRKSKIDLLKYSSHGYLVNDDCFTTVYFN